METKRLLLRNFNEDDIIAAQFNFRVNKWLSQENESAIIKVIWRKDNG